MFRELKRAWQAREYGYFFLFVFLIFIHPLAATLFAIYSCNG